MTRAAVSRGPVWASDLSTRIFGNFRLVLLHIYPRIIDAIGPHILAWGDDR